MSKNYGKGLNIELHPGLINPRLLKRGRNNNPYLDNTEVNRESRNTNSSNNSLGGGGGGGGKRRRIGRFYKKGDISDPLELERRQWKDTVLKIERGDLPDPLHDENKYILRVDDIPDIEWWDKRYYLPERLSEEEDESEDEDTFCPSIKYVLHPVPPELSNNVPFLGMRLYLTSRERKQLRRNKRRIEQEEREKKIKLGLLPKPTNKIKLSTIMNQQGQGIDLPTGWEKEVKNAMFERKREHDIMNQRRHEMAVKQRQENKTVLVNRPSGGSGGGVVWVRVYRFKQLINPSIRYKLSMNSKQLGIRGLCLRNGDNGPGMIIIMDEREKSIRFMNRLIMDRLPWRQSFMMKSHHGDESGKVIDMSNNEIKLVWTGQINLEEYNMFPNRWFMKVCQNEKEIKSVLTKFKAEHYYKYI